MTRDTTPRATRAAVLTLLAAPKLKRSRNTAATRRSAAPQSATDHALADYRRAAQTGAAKGWLTITDFGDGQRDVGLSGTFDNDPLHSIRALCAAMFSIVRRMETDAQRQPRTPTRVHGAEYSLRDRQ